MENRMVKQEQQILPPCSSGRRSSDSNSPEFEFWKVRNRSFPQPILLSADELFSDGVLLPLHLLNNHNSDDPPDINSEPPTPEPGPPPPRNLEPDSEPSSCSGPGLLASTLTTPSKRWTDIFKKSSSGNSTSNNGDDKGKEKKKDRKNHGGGNGASSAELNINIWPFSRSRSAGNGGSRPRMVPGTAATRKVSSAPCSRSNSAGESKSRKWPSSPSRGGVHLGRSSPVWQVRRGGSDPFGRSTEKGVKKEENETRRSKLSAGQSIGGLGTKAKALNLNVPMCIGYRHHLSCRSDENSAATVSAATAAAAGGQSGGVGGSGESGRATNLFNLKGFFTKKVY